MQGLATSSLQWLAPQRACLRGRALHAGAPSRPAPASGAPLTVVADGGKQKKRAKLLKKIKKTQLAVQEVSKLLEAAAIAEEAAKAEGASHAEAKFESERKRHKLNEERLERQILLLHEEVSTLKAQLAAAQTATPLSLAAPASSIVAAAIRDARNGSTFDTAIATTPLPQRPAPAAAPKPAPPAAAAPPPPPPAPAAAPPKPAVAKPAAVAASVVHPSWPLLSKGSDDIAAMAYLHSMLSEGGYHCGDEDMEDWIFGEGTLNALLTFQEVKGIPETGVTDAATWRALVGDNATRSCPFADAEKTIAETMAQKPAAPAPAAAAPAAAAAASGAPAPAGSALKHAGKWPNLRRDDGGASVRALQELLGEYGYYCGEEDMHFWFFGQGTEDALRFFQASKNVPESGITCDRTWSMLLGPERLAQGPDVLKTFVDEEEDMDQEGVYLLGEGRWERPERVGAGGKN